ncbi:hypothetical protein LTR35_012167 [Friedmanniomyces endolithicus]|uniref:DUF6314 domain-containing protein n=1 Tax=Friedmanniomyces endolithicus TaxID=329885 RepID=A0AAN6JG20_9PEZI|nr:hypothetical protein LTR35_012167 [Friedmanniomyces endolithicus]KAK0284419.1 hypothetical protein LTS00_011376 [Friedmanniomyces endolithicus]KAK0323071.1 hypothetical protein LTR82_006002 [Friedmanniomyces endolithicus]KAK0996041.1 hypothetical protein LTR54_010335 [Friedmanniomyces endolithicus]
MATKTPTAAIFDSLKGSWRLRRSLKSNLPQFPSGTFEGVATFRSRQSSANNVASELLYSEQGELRTDNGFVLKANRKYIYRYDDSEDKISAWFVTEGSKQLDGREEVDYLFHDIETVHAGSGWVGQGEHLCELDMYWAYYEFRLPKVMEHDQKMDILGRKRPAIYVSRHTSILHGIMKRHSRSRFEYSLLQSERREQDFRYKLFGYLDEPTLRRLRAVSPVVRDMVDSRPGRLFHDLFVHAPLEEDQPNREFERVANFCHNLTITVKERSPPSLELTKDSTRLQTLSRTPWWLPPASIVQNHAFYCTESTARLSLPFGLLPATERIAQTLANKKWTSIFTRCRQLRHLTLHIHGDPSWPGRTAVETTLVALRLALETSRPPNLREITYDPIHAMGIIHLRWSGALAPFGPASPPLPTNPTTTIWQNLQTLTLHLLNPFDPISALTPPQTLLAKKSLHAFLRSFTPTLHTLRFVYLDSEGPSPLTLHLETGLVGEREPLPWRALRELWVGNMTSLGRTLESAGEVAPGLEGLWVLRSGRGRVGLDYADEGAWVDHLPSVKARGKGKGTGEGEGEQHGHVRAEDAEPATAEREASLRGHSTGSDSVADVSDEDLDVLGGVSRTSRDVLCMLDTTGVPGQALEMRRRMERRRVMDSAVLGHSQGLI